uniref:Uncharacterized protein n=1 Tax=Globodera rostochiensis TaxID=31243 RepID=A0A914H9B5_GLORO
MLSLFFLLVIFAQKHENLFGLECKQGYESRLTGQKQAQAEECIDEPNAQYCVAVTCTTDEVIKFAQIIWRCEREQNKKLCAERAKEKAEKGTRLSNVACVCSYGAKGEDNGNAQFTLPAEPIMTQPHEKGTKWGLEMALGKNGYIENNGETFGLKGPQVWEEALGAMDKCELGREFPKGRKLEGPGPQAVLGEQQGKAEQMFEGEMQLNCSIGGDKMSEGN